MYLTMIIYVSTIVIVFIYVFYRRQEKSLMKLIVDSATDIVLGASMCGPDAPEIIQVRIS